MARILRYMGRRERICIYISTILVLGQIWLDLTLPGFMSDITRLIVTPGSAMSAVWAAGGKMLLCALGSAGLTVAVNFFSARLAADFSYTLREKVFYRVTDFGAGEMHRFSTPSLITRTTNDITQIQMLLGMGLMVVLRAPLMAVWAIMKIIGKSWQLSLVTAAAIVLIVIVIGILMVRVLPKFRIIQRQIDDVNRVTRENLSGLRIIRAFNAEQYQEDKFEDANVSLMQTQLFTARHMAILMPFISMIMSGLSLAIYWFGSYLVDSISLTGPESVAARVDLFSEVVVFSSYAIFVVMSFMMLIAIFVMLPRAQVSAARVAEIMDEDPAVKSGPGASGTESGSLSFRNVSFRYPDAAEDCLKDISFEVRPGETVAVIGATGSGKTTLVSLAARLFDATSGEILLDGKDIKQYTFDQLYRKVGFIAQRAVLFYGTVRDNMVFGDAGQSMSDEDILGALDIAQAADFVNDLPDGMLSNVAQGGANLSGGQRQRLSIARTLARRPEIIIFDDSFSALDYRTDAALRRRLASDLKGTTCVIVAQRIGTIRHADRIIVLDDGRIAGVGTHDELMKNCSVYSEIAYSQLSQLELEA